jgi:DNA polymerase III epsilon subunit-like protein
MKVLIFDFETTGLSPTRIIHQDTLHQWPHAIQFSYVVYDTEKEKFAHRGIRDYIIKIPKDCVLTEESIQLHGITRAMSEKKGLNIEYVFSNFFYYVDNVDMLIAHNIEFDLNMLKVELLRLIYSKDKSIADKYYFKKYFHKIYTYPNIHCSMNYTKDLCNIEREYKNGTKYNKKPKLSELHQKLFQCEAKQLHNSLCDVFITLRCFMKYYFDKDVIEQKNMKCYYKNLI